MAHPEQILIQVKRFPECKNCSTVKKAAREMGEENQALRIFAVEGCKPADLETAVDTHIIGFELAAPGDDLFNREDATMRVSVCPGRQREREAQINKAMGLRQRILRAFKRL